MEEHTPVWIMSVCGAIIALLGVGYALVRFFYHIRDQQLAFRAKQLAHENAVRESGTEQGDTNRRNAATEAWEVVDRLTKELEGVTPRIFALQKRCDDIKEEGDERERAANLRADRCEGEHEGTKRVLRLVVSWARARGMKLDPLLDYELNRTTSDNSAYGVPPNSDPPITPPPK